MCGIVGAVAQRNVVPILLEGLRRLEYRGYDSAGLVIVNGGLKRVRSVGRVASLSEECAAQRAHGHLGIAHTRWATHGAPSERNAHPHVSASIAVVHNGIIENHEALRTRLKALGYAFTSDTDTEVIVHLIQHYSRQSKDLLAATRAAVAELVGAYAIGVVSEESPNQLICARKGSPLLIGLGIEENFIASDVSALLPVTQRVIYLEEGDIADIGLLSVKVFDATGQPAVRSVHISANCPPTWPNSAPIAISCRRKSTNSRARWPIPWSDCRGAGPRPARVVRREAAETFARSTASFPCLRHQLPCGKSGALLAGRDCRYSRASWKSPANTATAPAWPTPTRWSVTISQSGETADTLAAFNHAKAMGQDTRYHLQRAGKSRSFASRGCKFLTRAGPEIGVASTKAFTTQLAALFLLTLVLAKLRGRLPQQEARAPGHPAEASRHLPNAALAC